MQRAINGPPQNQFRRHTALQTPGKAPSPEKKLRSALRESSTSFPPSLRVHRYDCYFGPLRAGRRRKEIGENLDEFARFFEERHVAALFEDHEFRAGNGLMNFISNYWRNIHVEAAAHD